MPLVGDRTSCSAVFDHGVVLWWGVGGIWNLCGESSTCWDVIEYSNDSFGASITQSYEMVMEKYCEGSKGKILAVRDCNRLSGLPRLWMEEKLAGLMIMSSSSYEIRASQDR